MKSWKLVLPLLHTLSYQIFSKFFNLEFISRASGQPHPSPNPKGPDKSGAAFRCPSISAQVTTLTPFICSVAQLYGHGLWVASLGTQSSTQVAHLVSEDQGHHSTGQLDQQADTKDVHELQKNKCNWALEQNKPQLLFQSVSLNP